MIILKKLLLFNTLFLFFILTNVQHFKDVVVWQSTAKSGGKFIGVANDSFEAQEAIQEISFLKEGTKYQIIKANFEDFKINFTNSTISVKEDFISDNEYLEYKYISGIELISLQYVEKGDYSKAISFYKSVNRTKDEKIIEGRLNKLHSNYAKYLYPKQSPEEIVAASE